MQRTEPELERSAFLTSIKDAECDVVVGSRAAPCSNGRGVPPRMNLGHQSLVAFF
jgi:hypothetical protein